ncbi:MAG: DNA-directed RNA polymerase subunit alpha C-terminal domain-containing protein [Hafnia sp.]
MSNTAEQITTQTRITDEVLHLSFVGVYNQLNLTLRRISGDDLDRRALETSISMIEQLQSDVNARLDDETSDCNGIIEQLETTKNQLLEMNLYKVGVQEDAQAKEDELEELRHGAKMKALELENSIINLNKQIESSAQELTTAQLAYGSLKASFDAYKRLHPESLVRERDELTRKVSKLRADRKDTNKRLQSMQSKLNEADKEVATARSNLITKRQDVDRLNALYEHLKKRVDFHDGREQVQLHTVVTEKGDELNLYIYNYHFGLLARNNHIKGHVIELADFHFQIRTAMLVAMDVVPGVWGNPIYERLSVFEKAWNPAIDEELHQRIMGRLEMDFPKIHKRAVDAVAADIDELTLPGKVLSALKNAGFNNVQSIASVLPFELVAIKGVGEQAATDITNAVNSWAIRWSRENGDIETYKSNVICSAKPSKGNKNK